MWWWTFAGSAHKRGAVNLFAILYALLAAVTGLSLGGNVVERPVAASALTSAVQVEKLCAVIAERAPMVANAFRAAPVAARVVVGEPLALIDRPLSRMPGRRRE